MQLGQILLWMVATYLLIGVAALIVVRGIAWLQAESLPGPNLSWREELKVAFWTIVLWPLLALVVVVLAVMFFIVSRIVRKFRRDLESAINQPPMQPTDVVEEARDEEPMSESLPASTDRRPQWEKIEEDGPR